MCKPKPPCSSQAPTGPQTLRPHRPGLCAVPPQEMAPAARPCTPSFLCLEHSLLHAVYIAHSCSNLLTFLDTMGFRKECLPKMGFLRIPFPYIYLPDTLPLLKIKRTSDFFLGQSINTQQCKKVSPVFKNCTSLLLM